MTSFGTMRVAPPEGASADEIKEAGQANVKLFKLVGNIADADTGYGVARFAVMAALALIALCGSVALIGAAIDGEGWAAAASSAAVIATVAVAGLLNPLQTIERDIIVRRWSDLIVSGWATDVGGSDITPDLATKHASERFAVLAAAYSTMTGKTLDTLAAVAVPPKSEDDEDAEEPAAEVTITAVSPQSAVQGQAVDSAVVVEAEGGSGTYKFTATGLPTGLTIAESSGEITGTVTNDAQAREWIVEVTATEVPKAAMGGAAAPTAQSGSTKFVWTVTAAPAAG